jgi:glutamate racemase
MTATRGVLVLDWDIGGLPTHNALRQAAPGIPLTYLSDSGYEPYGRVERDDLLDRLSEIGRYAARREVPTIAVACNAVSSVLDRPETDLGNGVTAVSLIHTFLESFPKGSRSIGVIGGFSTINNGEYRNGLESCGYRVSQQVAQELSAIVESADYSGIDDTLRRIIGPVRDANALILGCTHYPAVSHRITKLFPHLDLIDPSQALVDYLAKTLKPATSESVPSTFFTTGDPVQSRLAAQRAFGINVEFARIDMDLAQ